jgi:hypothetical protein
MPSKKTTTVKKKKSNPKSITIGRSKKSGHSIMILEKEYKELMVEVGKMEPTDNEAVFRGQLHGLIQEKFKGRFSLKQVDDKKYKELKGKWIPKK